MRYVISTEKSTDQGATDLTEAVTRHGFGVLHVHDLRETLETGTRTTTATRSVEILRSLIPMSSAWIRKQTYEKGNEECPLGSSRSAISGRSSP